MWRRIRQHNVPKCSANDDSLIDHVAYYKLSSRTEACYANVVDAFWEYACRAYGLGLAACDGPPSDGAWKELAVKCVEHAWKCEHSACGMPRLQKNCASYTSFLPAYLTCSIICRRTDEVCGNDLEELDIPKHSADARRS